MATPQEGSRSIGASITSGRRRDAVYRAGLVLQVLGTAALAVLYPVHSPYYSAGIMLFELGVLLSALTLRVWISWIRYVILGSVLSGLPLQAYAILAAPAEAAGPLTIAGIGLVCIGAAGIAGKEAYCFAWRAGWALLWLFPALVVLNLVAREHLVLNSLGFSGLFLLLLSLAGKKLGQPIVAGGCDQPARCGTTDAQTSD